MNDIFKQCLDDVVKSQARIYRAEIAAELETELRQLSELEAALQKITQILGEDHD